MILIWSIVCLRALYFFVGKSLVGPGGATVIVGLVLWTVGQLIEDALRASLMRRDSVEQRGRVRLITMPGTGTRPGIDLDHSHALPEIMGRTP